MREPWEGRKERKAKEFRKHRARGKDLRAEIAAFRRAHPGCEEKIPLASPAPTDV